MAFERNTAKKITVKEIKYSVFVKKEGFESSYLVTDYGNISRVNLLGVIVGVEGSNTTLDDGTGNINLRSFETLKKTPELGNVVMVIGKPRVFNNEKFIVPEIIKELENKKWIEYRKKELELRTKIEKKETVEEKPKAPEVEKEIKKEFEVQQEEETIDLPESPSEKIKQFLKQQDSGKGVSIAEIETLKIENLDKIIKNMLMGGEIFEIRPGFVKLMD